MKHLALLAFAALSLSCSKPQNFYIDSDFAPYVADFEREFNLNVAINISFVDRFESPTRLAFCRYFEHKIIFSRAQWDIMVPAARELVVWHELGHCLFSLPHDDRKDGRGQPLSIMSTYTPPTDYYVQNRAAYLQHFKAATKGR